MIKFPKAKVHGNSLVFPEIEQQKAESDEQKAVLLDAKRYRYVRDNMGLPAEEFDNMVDEHMVTDSKNGL